uniref:Putative GIY YIG homing endonuclease n=1 Tax=Oogamochlamys gigantea TaxID=158507 RepID=A0A0S2LN37_9CHLO|nr:putative GIY YIG homing endonuclease [Oogamochlamys gigantea]ALO62831.1 putative GIY YIG homing endonuclease [Oogamochlamys gigantea]
MKNQIPTGPGLYKIKCLVNQKYYCGEAENLLGRLGAHLYRLRNKNHDYSELQKDWEAYGPDAFIFEVVLHGPKYAKRADRCKIEAQLMYEQPDFCYNFSSTRKNVGTIINKFESHIVPFGFGLYKITCSANQKHYYGESDNLLYRLGTHFSALNKGKSEINEMQKDWSVYGSSAFIFEIISHGSKYEDKAYRIQVQYQLINQEPGLCYNSVGNIEKIYVAGTQILKRERATQKQLKASDIQFPVVINDISYVSLNQIEKDFALSRKTIKKRLLAQNKETNLVWTEKRALLPHRGSEQSNKIINPKIQIYGNAYASVIEASKALKLSRTTIYNKLNDLKNKDFVYLDNKPERKFYTFTIDGIFYSSIKEVVDHFKLNPATIYRRCQSDRPLFKNWICHKPDKLQNF